jgi:hypothetical protein
MEKQTANSHWNWIKDGEQYNAQHQADRQYYATFAYQD